MDIAEKDVKLIQNFNATSTKGENVLQKIVEHFLET